MGRSAIWILDCHCLVGVLPRDSVLGRELCEKQNAWLGGGRYCQLLRLSVQCPVSLLRPTSCDAS